MSKLTPGTNLCLCRTCGEYFRNVKAFDRHRIGAPAVRGCLPVEEFETNGLALIGDFWQLTPKPYLGPKSSRIDDVAPQD